MGKPDALSRLSDHRSRQGDNNNLMLIAPELFWIHVSAGARLEGEERNILSDSGSAQSQRQFAKAARELQKDKSRGTVKGTEWSEITHISW
jgi:hypothetical protein